MSNSEKRDARMAPETDALPPIASPTIEEVFDQFLADQEQRLKPKTLSRYQNVIDLLALYLDGYGCEGLPADEMALFDTYFNAEGEDHKGFCQLFGPDHIVPNLGMFLDYFLIRQVMAGAEIKRSAGTVTKRLSKWLAEKGYMSDEDAEEGREKGAAAARTLPKAERAAQMLAEDAGFFFDASAVPDEDYLDFDHYTITKIEPGRIWLDAFLSTDGVVGPIAVPKKAAELLEEGWEISCALARQHGKWRLVEVANVYPR